MHRDRPARVRRRLLIAGTAAAAGCAARAPATSDGDAAAGLEVVLATATPGGGFPAFGDAFARTVADADPGLRVRPRNTRGSTENLPLVGRRAVDLGLVTGEALHEALAGGIGRPPIDLRILWAMFSSPGMFVVRRDSAARTIEDLLGRPVAFGARGSGLVILARYALDGLGYDLDRDFRAIYLERAADGPAMVIDGRATALWGGGSGWPGFTAVAGSAAGARFIAPDPGQVVRIVARHPLLRPMTVPAGSYAGQDGPIASVGSWSFVVARSDLPDDVGYRLAKALHRGSASLGRRLPQAVEATAANTAAANPRPDLLHPGVRRYLRELGLTAGAPTTVGPVTVGQAADGPAEGGRPFTPREPPVAGTAGETRRNSGPSVGRQHPGNLGPNPDQTSRDIVRGLDS